MPAFNGRKKRNGLEALGHAPTFKVGIDRHCIDKGMQKNSNHCMIAKAVKKSHPELSRISVDIQTIRATDVNKGERYVWLTPPGAQRLIVDFDAGKKPAPTVCTLRSGQTLKVETRKKRKTQTVRQRKVQFRKPNKKASRVTRIPGIIGGHEPPRSIGARRHLGLRALAA